MEDSGEMKEDVKIPDNDLGKEIQAKFDADEQIMVTILFAMGEEAAVGTKPINEKK